ncbi:MAG TPA: tripartite tricarboxylate transporter substrate binding protein [Casimicrobiaceae bacterium]|nr:tripartite tricarboxylate transporter substrate binding protein [Casimicrobiaceae bacterium]
MNALRGLAALCTALAAVVPAAHAQDYPSRPIRMIVPFPPGGGADLTARVLAQRMGDALKQPVVVENKPGANGVLGTDAVAKSAPDGYTILLVDRGALGINPSLYTKLPYDPLKDFASIGIATEAPYVMVTNPSVPAKSVTEFIALARATPGAVNYGSFGTGSMAQLNLENFGERHGVRLQHVPYKGAGPAVAAVVAGEVQVTVASAPSVLGFLKDGRLRALAVGSDKRLGLLPDVPTLAEAGGGQDVLIPTFFALAAPAGTPIAVVQKLNAAMRDAVLAPDVAEKLVAQGLVPTGGSPEAMTATVAQDVQRFAALAKAIGLKPE